MNIPMFHPYVPKQSVANATEVLKTKWLAQGPKVEEFEAAFNKKMGTKYSVAVNSGTTALTLAYYLAGIKKGSNVIAPALTCSATNLPLLHAGAKIKFADIGTDLNPSALHIEELMTRKTKAIVNVHLNGNLNEIGEFPVIVIGDMAQTHLPPSPNEDITCYSFQAIKTITTGDGGMLVFKDKELYERAKKLRWFGIDRDNRQKKMGACTFSTTSLDMVEPGWKYHMNDITASIGLGSLGQYDKTIKHLYELKNIYDTKLSSKNVGVIGGIWTYPIIVHQRKKLCNILNKHGIEASIVQARNDLLTPFGAKRQRLPVLDVMEELYLHLPLHAKMTKKDVNYICKVINDEY